MPGTYSLLSAASRQESIHAFSDELGKAAFGTRYCGEHRSARGSTRAVARANAAIDGKPGEFVRDSTRQK